MLRVVLKIFAFIGFGVAVAWVYFEPNKYDSWVAAIAALVVLLGLFLPDALRRGEGQHQHIADDSTGIQAGGDVTISVNSNGDRR